MIKKIKNVHKNFLSQHEFAKNIWHQYVYCIASIISDYEKFPYYKKKSIFVQYFKNYLFSISKKNQYF